MAKPIKDSDPIFDACRTGNVETVKKFLATGGDPHAESKWNPPIASIALAHGHLNIIDILLASGLDINRPFNKFEERLIFIAIRAKDPQTVAFLLDKGADINGKDKFGFSGLHLAAANGSLEVVRLFVERGANTKAAAQNGVTPMAMAALNDQAAVMEYLLAQGVDLKHVSPLGDDLLFMAARSGKVESIQFLLKHGFDPYKKGQEGLLPIELATKNGHEGAAELLRSYIN